MNPGFLPGLLAAALAVSLWGIQLPVAKDAFATLDLYHMTAIRYALPALFLSIVLILREGPAAMSYRGAFAPAVAFGIVGMCGSPLLVFIGMSMSRAEHAAVIVALQPSIAAIALWYLRGLRPTNFTIACIAVAFVGVVLVVTKGQWRFAESAGELFGDFIVLVGAACWVVYTLGMARFAGWSTWRITALTMIPGAIATITVTELVLWFGHIERPTLATLYEVRFELTYLSFIGVVLALLLWNFANRRVGPQNTTLLINLLPVATFAYRSAQGYRFQAIELFGAALVVCALIANNLYVRNHAVVR